MHTWSDVYENIFVPKRNCEKYLTESCSLLCVKQFLFKYFATTPLVEELCSDSSDRAYAPDANGLSSGMEMYLVVELVIFPTEHKQ